jgi:NDP-sugar pyrophosphorylase family protein
MQEPGPERVKAVILAGGRGTRLRPFTVVLPKPLVPLGDKPVLEILLRRLAGFGFREVVVSTGHLAELIMAVCGDGSRFGVSVSYSHEPEPLGTAGPLARIEGLSDPAIVMNGDLLTTLSLPNIISYHVREQADVTIGTYRRQVQIDFGVIETDAAGRFVGFREKPVHEMDVSMGVNVLSARAVGLIPRGERLDMPDLILRVRDAGLRVCCYREECHWLDIGRMDDYARAQEEFAENESRYLASG